MTTLARRSPVTVAAGRPEQAATRLTFLIAGLAVAAWAPMVPYAKARAGLDDGALGLLLLGLGIGSIVAMPVAGALTTRFGCRRVIVPATALMALALPFLATLSDPVALGLALAVFGVGLGGLDCAMNVQAIIVERASGRAMMSGFHGLYSLGGILGAGGVSAMLGLGASPLLSGLAVVALLAGALVVAYPNLLPRGTTGSGPVFALPRGPVLLIGVLCSITFLAEGSVLDWGAVFLTSERNLGPAVAGLGYAAFSLAMTICRLTGDGVVERLGPTRVLVLGGLCAAAGLSLTTLVPFTGAGLAGFTLVGVGCANMVPVLFTATGRQTAMPTGTAVAAVTTLGYAGILAGPAGIGFLAQATSLTGAFLAVAVLLLAVAASAHKVRV